METAVRSLPENQHWQSLLEYAGNRLGNKFAFYEAREKEYLNALIKEYKGQEQLLFDAVLQVLQQAREDLANFQEVWVQIKEGVTVLYHLKQKKVDLAWQPVIKLLWELVGNAAQDNYTVYLKGHTTKSIPRDWRKKKYVIDALLMLINEITPTNRRFIDRFFEAKVNDYWKAFKIHWKVIWGEDHANLEEYFQEEDFRDSYKQSFFKLFIYRLIHANDEFKDHGYKHTRALSFLEEHAEVVNLPSNSNLRRAIYYALFIYLIDAGFSLVDTLEKIKGILGEDDAFRYLITHRKIEADTFKKLLKEDDQYLLTSPLQPKVNSITAADKGMLLLHFPDLEERWEKNTDEQYQILEFILDATEHHKMSTREGAIKHLRLERRKQMLIKHLRYVEKSQIADRSAKDVFRRIHKVCGEEAGSMLLNEIEFTPFQKGKILLGSIDLLEQCWDSPAFPNQDNLLPLLLAVVKKPKTDDGALQDEAENFLKRKSDEIKNINRFLDQNEEKASVMLVSTIRYGSESALKTILERCAFLVAGNQNGTLVDRITQEVRQVPGAILILVNLLNNRISISSDAQVKAYVKNLVLDRQQNPTIKRIFHREEEGGQPDIPLPSTNGNAANGADTRIRKIQPEHLSVHDAKELYEWCFSQKAVSKTYADLFTSREDKLKKADETYDPAETYQLVRLILDAMEQEAIGEREIAVQKWISQLLSEMSDEWFFEENPATYQSIQKQLIRFAIEPLSKRLPKEQNLDIRENIVKILGNTGGRVAVDALVRTVTGEEREKAARQELLSEYYLKPSKARSEEASIMLNDAVDNAKKTMRLLQTLNVATFVMGVILILGGVTIGIFSEGNTSAQVTSVLSGLGGLTAILTQFLKDPLDRIQRAMADLVQVQTAFTSFVWELNLNGTYIQSQYVSEGNLTDFDLRQTIGRIDVATERTIHSIQTYASGGEGQQPAQLQYIIPNFDASGSSFTLLGQALRGKGTEKDKCQLVINHLPFEGVAQVWTDQHTTFMVDAGFLQKFGHQARVWVSLSINGKETNALPVILELKNIPAKAKVAKPAGEVKESIKPTSN